MKQYIKIVFFSVFCIIGTAHSSLEWKKSSQKPHSIPKTPFELESRDELDKKLAELVIKMNELLKLGANPDAFASILTEQERSLLPASIEKQNEIERKKKSFFIFILGCKDWSQNLFDQINANFDLLKSYNLNDIIAIIRHLVAILCNKSYINELQQMPLVYEITKKNGLFQKVFNLPQIKKLTEYELDQFLIDLSKNPVDLTFQGLRGQNMLILLENMRPKKTFNPSPLSNKKSPWINTNYFGNDDIENIIKTIIKNQEFDLNEILSDLITAYRIVRSSRPEFMSPETIADNQKKSQQLRDLITFAILHGGSLNPEVPIDDTDLQEVITKAEQAKKEQTAAQVFIADQKRRNVSLTNQLHELLGVSPS